MTSLVVDASVVIKWLFPDRRGEQNTAMAINLLEHVRRQSIHLHQPMHWLAEVAAVAVRLSPNTAEEDVHDLRILDCTVHDSLAMYRTACRLSRDMGHHLFDTLYHAVALTVPDAALITADDRYYHKANGRGRIVRLEESAALLRKATAPPLHP